MSQDWEQAWNGIKDRVFHLNVAGALDLIYDDIRRVYVELRIAYFYEHPLWNHYRLPSVTVS